ncbi:hypothetical protein ABE218_10345 [Bacillus smithii]|uniref:hypothetical protein n=1 Tax=Bacillus smithii TaxID=1479 RepID=UPI003D255658
MHRNTRRKKSPGFCIFLGYRWCGPRCSGPGAPINDVDACRISNDKEYYLVIAITNLWIASDLK